VGDWKQHHANESEKALDQDLVQSTLSEFASNMGFKREGLPEYGLAKIVSVVAQVARAEALGFDPELLRLSSSEAAEQQLRLAQIAAKTGKPIFVLELDEEADSP
jgi:hypothetical protein